MARGWGVPQHPPDWVRYMGQAAGNRAMRDLLQRPALPPATVAPERSIEPAAALALKELPTAPDPVQPIWRRLAAKLSDWRK